MPKYSSKCVLNYRNECHKNDKQKTGNNDEIDIKIQDRLKQFCRRVDLPEDWLSLSLFSKSKLLTLFCFV